MVTKTAGDYWIPAFAGMTRIPLVVMAGPGPAIHTLTQGKTWMPGTRPGMTKNGYRRKIKNMDFDLSEEQRLLKESVDGLLNDAYDFDARKKYAEGEGRLEQGRSGASSPNRACSACRSPRRTAVSAPAPWKP